MSVVDYCIRVCRSSGHAWNRFWFSPLAPHTLGVMRIAVGILLLANYITLLPSANEFIGAQGWLDETAREQVVASAGGRRHPDVYSVLPRDWVQSVYAVFLVSMAALTLGVCTRLANLLAWIGHLSFLHRSIVVWYGLDVVLAMLLLYLLIAPAGDAYSVDQWLRRRRGKGDCQPSVAANVATRMIQIHMCIIYGAAGLAKLQGASWWEGTAIWYILMINELTPIDFRFLASLGDRTILILSGLATTGTVVFELSFPILVWKPLWRPLILAGSVCLHVAIGWAMGLVAFGVAMLIGCLAFVPPDKFGGATGRKSAEFRAAV